MVQIFIQMFHALLKRLPLPKMIKICSHIFFHYFYSSVVLFSGIEERTDYSVNGLGITDRPTTRVSEGLSQWHFSSVLETGALVESEPQDAQAGGSS